MVTPCRSCVNRLFRGTYRLHLQGRKIRERGTTVSRWLQTEPPVENTQLADFSTLKMEAIRSSETYVHTRSTRRHIPEDGILHSHRCENLKSYTVQEMFVTVRILSAHPTRFRGSVTWRRMTELHGVIFQQSTLHSHRCERMSDTTRFCICTVGKFDILFERTSQMANICRVLWGKTWYALVPSFPCYIDSRTGNPLFLTFAYSLSISCQFSVSISSST
jgi:hypothetical protein